MQANEHNALVLSGGGSRGNYHVGALRSLSKGGKKYDILAGSSVGAIICAFLAQFPNPLEGAQELYDMFSTLRNLDVYNKKYFLGHSNSLYSSTPLKRLIHSTIDQDRVIRSGVSLRIPVTVLNTGKTYLFKETDPGLLDAILASCSIPLVFPPVWIDGLGFCVDGSVLRDSPLRSVIDLSPTSIDVISLNPAHITRENVGPGLKTVLFRTIELVTYSLFEKDLDALAHMNEIMLLRYGTKVDTRLLRPSKKLPHKLLDFEGYHCEYMRSVGEMDAMDESKWKSV